MRGLLIKDFRLFANQKQFLTTAVLIAVIFLAAGQDVLFAIGYCTMLCIFFTISTISYDEYNNGFAFIFTMPVTRRGYVLEKYLFGLLIGGGAWLIATVAGFIYSSMTITEFVVFEWMISAVMVFIVMGILLCAMIPIQIKFGAEKSRVAMLVFSLAMFGAVVAAQKVMSMAGVEAETMERISNMTMAGWLLIGGVALIAVLAISIYISVRIVEKKQF